MALLQTKAREVFVLIKTVFIRLIAGQNAVGCFLTVRNADAKSKK